MLDNVSVLIPPKTYLPNGQRVLGEEEGTLVYWLADTLEMNSAQIAKLLDLNPNTIYYRMRHRAKFEREYLSFDYGGSGLTIGRKAKQLKADEGYDYNPVLTMKWVENPPELKTRY